MFNIIVKTIQGKTFELCVPNNATLKDLFIAASMEMECTENDVRLTYNKQRIDEWDTTRMVAEYVTEYVTEESIIMYGGFRFGDGSSYSVQGMSCAICMMHIHNVFVSKPCRHVYSQSCVVQQIKHFASLFKKCAVCRQDIESYVPLSAVPSRYRVFAYI